MQSKVRDIVDNLETVLAAITGVQKVYRVGAIVPSIAGRAAGTDFPVVFLSPRSRSPDEGSKGTSSAQYGTLTVSVLMLDNGRTETDQDWSANRAIEMEQIVDAAVLASPTRGGHASWTYWRNTVYNPPGFAQVDSAVGMDFEIRHRTAFGDLTSIG